MDSYNQQVFYNEEYDQEEEQQNAYWEDHGYPTHSYSPYPDDSQYSFEDDSYPQYPLDPQPNSGPSIFEMLAMIQANQEADRIDQEAYQTRVTQDCLEMLQNFQSINQRLDELVARGQVLESILAQQAIENGDLDGEREVSEEEVFESRDDRLLNCSFEKPGQAIKELDEDDSSIKDYTLRTLSPPPMSNELESLDGDKIEEENIEQKGFQEYEDFVEIYMDATREQPRMQEDTSLQREIEEWAPKEIIEKLKEGVPIKLETNFEDSFFIPTSRDKFGSFVPYFARSLEGSSHDPFILKGSSYLKGSKCQRKVHCRLDGKKFKWDLKVD